MFITFFHTFLLILQLLISDSSKLYNEKLIRLNFALNSTNYNTANQLIKDLKSQSFFYNNEIENLNFTMDLKQKSTIKDFQLKNKILKSIYLFEKGQKKESIEILKSEISLNQNDSIIKWFEIIYDKVKIDNKQSQKELSTNKINAFNTNEAIDLLNLMKNKEKYIKYE
ncbi:MAG: hypothetical protein RI995_1525 [Bacteroidota bacterium]